MKKLIFLLIFLFTTHVFAANEYRTRYNPWTHKLDYHLGTDSLEVGDLIATGTVTGLVVDTQYIEYSSGGALTVRDDLVVNGSITDNGGAISSQYLKLDCSNDPLTAGLTITGSADETQLTVTGNATQTSDLFVVEKSDGTDYFHVEELGEVHIIHVADHNDDRSFEIDTDGAAFGDVKSIDINYTTGAIVKGEDEAVILINIDETAATGGDIDGIEILATEGASGSTVEVHGLKAGVGVGPIHHDSGTFANPDVGTNNTTSTNVPNMIDGNSSNTTAIFQNADEYIIIGATTAFEEMEVILTTSSSGGGIKPKFEYSQAGSGVWVEFSPVDGTNGFRNTGIIAWNAGDLTNHGLNTDTTPDTYGIKITRQRANLSTTPVLGYIKTAATTEYIWDKNGDVNIRNLTASNTVTGLVVDTQYIEYSSGGPVTVRDSLTINGTLTTPTITNNTNIKGLRHHLLVTIIDPLAAQTEDSEICLWPKTDATLTVTKITVTLDAAANEVAGDLKYADAFIGLANPVVINAFDTSSGVLEDDTITSGSVPSGKCIYLSFDSAPHTDIKQMCADIKFDYD